MKNSFILIFIFILSTLFKILESQISAKFIFTGAAELIFATSQIATALQIFIVSFFIVRMCVHFTRQIFLKTTSAQLPKILENVITVISWTILTFIVLAFVYNISVNTVVATSGVSLAILGFAVKSLLLDFFSGIAIGVERAFDIGDWIEVENGITGKVTGMNWRAVRIITLENKEIVIPNNRLSSNHFVNISKPNPYFRTTIKIILDYKTTSYQAERILLGAANMVEEACEAPNPPSIFMGDFTSRGVEWFLYIWSNDYQKHFEIIYKIKKNILRNLYFSGIDIPAETIRMFGTIIEENNDNGGGIEYFLRKNDIFYALTKEELESILQSGKRRLFLGGSEIVKEGEDGESLFLVVEGLASVMKVTSGGENVELSKLGAGDFFGEMSLLTGEPRMATVRAFIDTIVFEIPKEGLKPILEGRSEPLDSISMKLAERKIQNEIKLTKQSQEKILALKSSFKDHFEQRISRFFNLIKKI